MNGSDGSPFTGNEIAVVGMSVRVAGARDVRGFWRNLVDEVESIRRYSDEELRAAGVPPHLLGHARYVRAGAPLEEMEHFDAEFFGFSPKEAAILDPQHRHFLELCWEALEDAGHPPERFPGSIGVFAGSGQAAYFATHLLTNAELVEEVGLFLLRHTGNDKDFLTTRVSYLFDLKGPSVNVQTACSTSLVAVHLAAQSLLSGECDLALAGGVTIELPHRQGYLFQPGEILSPDGHCRAFDAASEGTVFGSGGGVVALRRLSDALDAGDRIIAVLRGSAVNNDGAGKVGYLAPSVDGQAAAVAEALAIAEVSPDSIGYVETHGTGTPMGDPIEIAALTQAFRTGTVRSGFCAIGSLKTNIGHTDTAAGVLGFAKAALAVERGILPASLHFERPNPNIEFESTPFSVNGHTRPWPADGPRRAGVNSLGVGGTNAHAVLEQPPALAPSDPPRAPYQLLALSARTRGALDAAQARLAEHLAAEPELELADVAYSLAVGRRAFAQRRVLAARDRAEALRLLSGEEPARIASGRAPGSPAKVVFLLPGGGAQHPAMGRGLYDIEPVYREWMDRGLARLREVHGLDLSPLLFAPPERRAEVARELERPALQLPAIFLVEIALAHLWMSRGVVPAALLGHSLGENTAACLAGVLSFEDALGLVVLRGRLFEQVPEGGMLSVPLPRAELEPLLAGELDLATVNAPELCVASGPLAGLQTLERRLAERSIEAQRIPIHIAAHSRMLEPILAEFRAYLRAVQLHPPRIPFLSNRSGDWIRPEEATDPEYWVAHLRGTVQFSEGVRTLIAEGGPMVLLEVGPGRTLSSLARQQPGIGQEQVCLSSLRHPDEAVPDDAYLATVHGRLWAAGVPIELADLWRGERRRKVALPTYPFQRQRFWIEPGRPSAGGAGADGLVREPDPARWHWRTSWRETPLPPAGAGAVDPGPWLVFADGAGLGRRLAERLRAGGADVVVVREGDALHRFGPDEYSLAPEHGRTGFDQLLRELGGEGRLPRRIALLWPLTTEEGFRPGSSFFHRTQERGFFTLVFLAQALAAENLAEPPALLVVANGMLRTRDEALPYPEKATLLGPARVLPRELAGAHCRIVDLDLGRAPAGPLGRGRWREALQRAELALAAELAAPADDAVVAWRGGTRWVEGFERDSAPPPELSAVRARLRPKGTYLITGGLGDLGLEVAGELAREVGARLVLLGRTALPERSTWAEWRGRLEPGEPLERRLAAIEALEAAGAEVLTVAADVTDVEEMRAALAAARARFGPLHGVIHTAGVVQDGLLATKNQHDLERVLAPKVQGTLVLDQLLEGEPELDFLALFSSTSARIAPAGQSDYVAANAFLDAFARSRAGRERPFVVSVAWGIWSEVGMAAKALAGGDTPRLTERPARHPLFARRRGDGRRTTFLEAEWEARALWLLDEHRTADGAAVMPGSAVPQLARAALGEIGEDRALRLEDLYFFRPLHVPDETTVRVRARLEPDEEGYQFAVQSLADLEDGRSGWQTHAQARLLLARRETPAPVELDPWRARLQQGERAHGDATLDSTQEHHLAFGPRWRVLRALARGEGEALAELALADMFQGDLVHHPLHPGLLDLGTGFALDLVPGRDPKDLWVPVSYRSLAVHAPLTARLFAHARLRPAPGGERDVAVFDVTLCDPAGRVLVEARGFSMKRLGPPTALAHAPRPRPTELEFESSGGDTNVERPRSRGERALERNLAQGLPPREGARRLLAILDRGQLCDPVVSTLDLARLADQVAELSKEAEPGGAGFARPELDSDYLEPRDDLERTLVGFWQELLGVDRVGVRDSFFDLGGHSLIAVRLFARIRQAFDVDWPISVLFEAPTVESVAKLLEAAVGDRRAAAPADGRPAAPERRYRHLVPMHSGSGDGHLPFFIVAGMFGNVLNLRHLSGLLGEKRDVWGLQARGLYGEEEPHTDFVESARDYLEELRQVQPSGPYLLAGFSGGGLIAYEMAQQLRAAGEETALVVLLDTPLPERPEATGREKRVIHLQRLRQQGLRYFTRWFADRVRWELGRLAKRFDDFSDEQSPSTFHSKTIEAAFRAALPRYRVAPYDGRVVLYRPKLEKLYDLGGGRFANRWREIVLEDNGWGAQLADLEVIEVPGDHDSMVLEPNVRVLATRLRRAIEAAEANWRALGGP